MMGIKGTCITLCVAMILSVVLHRLTGWTPLLFVILALAPVAMFLSFRLDERT